MLKAIPVDCNFGPSQQYNEDAECDFGQNGARERFEKLVGDPKRQSANQGSPKIADTAKYDHHERVDDVALSEIRTDIVDLRQRDTGDAGDPGSKSEGECVD